MGQTTISLKSITKSYGSRVLFENVNASFLPGKRYGLTGPNGAGKSTLMKIIMKFEEPTSGSVTLPDRVGILKQNITQYGQDRVIDVVIMGNQRLWDVLQERDRLYLEEMTDEIGNRLGEIEEVIAEEDGYSAESEAEVLLSGMGIAAENYEMPLKTLPLDQQFRVLLCQALFGNPQALLLDEPTNHLDLESIGWLENFLLNYKGVLIVISHDRHFLNAVTTDIADIDYQTIILYPGNYDDMVEAKTSVRQRCEDEMKSKEKRISQLQEFVSKFRSGTRASQVQSRLREIERLQPEELKKSNIQRPYIRFIPSQKKSGKAVFKLEGVNKGYGEKQVIRNLSLEIMSGDKVGIIGNNGLGKSTLMKLLAGVESCDKGKVEVGYQVLPCYFPQIHSDLIDKNDQSTAFDWLRSRKDGIYDQEIRSSMGKLLFSGDDAFKKVNHLSGGETARVIIAGMMLSEHNLLLMDEPNGHLDLEAVSALAWAINNYPETVVFVTHDRDLIASAAKKLIIFEDDSIIFFDGTYEEYISKKGSGGKR
jgi:ATPase subunit of ABC transporter with duplicated ATPase domains